jgi:symplekin
LTDDFSLEDIPPGHPIITREALESIAEYAFTTLCGFVLIGGQVKIDENFLSEGNNSGTPSSQVASILKPAALAFLALESSVTVEDNDLVFNVDRVNTELEFSIGHKSYALSINAVSMLATNRPMFYKEGATCLARRAVDPPTESAALEKSASLAISAHLRASCLTLLRNALSVTTNGHEVLHKALSRFDMTIQADKALKMAAQTSALKTAGRAARNRAAMFYEWDDSEDKRTNKRQRETDDALAKMRAAKAAKGLGNGIQLPSSMVDSVELVLLNLEHLPPQKPSGGNVKNRKRPITFDYVVDAVMTNGVSLSEEDGQWYERDGGSAWIVDLTHDLKYHLEGKTLLAGESEQDKDTAGSLEKGVVDAMPKVFQRQCQTAAAQAFSRIVQTTNRTDQGLSDFGSKIAARLAWTLQNVLPTKHLKDAHMMASESALQVSKKMELREPEGLALSAFVEKFPLVAACLSVEVTETARAENGVVPSMSYSSLVNNVMNEIYMASCKIAGGDASISTTNYGDALDVLIASTIHASNRANDKPNDIQRKQAATRGATLIMHQLSVLPALSPLSLRLLSGLSDIQEITKKAADSSKKASQQSIATSASMHAAKIAAEKRATLVLVALRDVVFQRTKPEVRKDAVECAVAIASGRYPSSLSIEDKALKLVMNVLFPKSDLLANMVLEAATSELVKATQYAIDNFDEIQQANVEAAQAAKKKLMAPGSDKEKKAIEYVKKPAVLFMALCVRRPEMIKVLMTMSCQEKAHVLSKAVRENMPKLARAVATKHGAASIALEIASMADQNEIPIVLAFLENLSLDKSLPPEELVEACHKIQESKLTPEGKKDPRFIIPVVSGMKRQDLVDKLPEFVAAENHIFIAALVRMADRVTRQALLFRDEPDPSNPLLTGMTFCEQLVFLHKMDFAAVGLPQKRYLVAIRNCLEDDSIFTDRVVMAAMDYISGVFLSEKVELPLAYMRTIMLVCSKHESLHNWICHVLLPRLIEGEVYQDRRQWEGWMRCARMLEKPGESGVSSADAIRQLPPEQLQIYRTKYANE